LHHFRQRHLHFATILTAELPRDNSKRPNEFLFTESAPKKEKRCQKYLLAGYPNSRCG